MRTLRFLLAVVALVGCRDEQAGPQAKTSGASRGKIKSVETVPSPLTFSSGATWNGGTVTYLGSMFEPAKPKAGDQVQMKHYFRADGNVPGKWGFFMHVVDDSTKQQMGNLDHEIQQGAAPLGTWPQGKIIEDAHTFLMPNVPNPLRLYLGFWNDSGRLRVDTLHLSDGDNRVSGPKLDGSAPSALPEYVTRRAARAPVIDGKLDDAAWGQVKEQTLTRSFDGGPVTRKTTFRIVYDDVNLYVAFRAEDPDVWGSLTKKDDPIYNEDVVEVFLDADGDEKTYNELQVSPHNVNFDASFVARRSDLPAAMKWESGMKTAVFVKGSLDDDSDTDEYWSAEMQIPLAKLTAVPHVPPQKGDRWRFNAYRLEHLARRTNIEGQSFSPLFVGDFHALPRFGWLSFQ